MYYVYLIQCEDKSIYTGITTNLKRRFKEHADKLGGHYTRAHKVKEILYSEEHSTRSDALKREAEIKSWPREKKLKLANQKK
ncbi:MAG: GIY-YIG nuclease family protein [Patescibacteria group bacterium]